MKKNTFFNVLLIIFFLIGIGLIAYGTSLIIFKENKIEKKYDSSKNAKDYSSSQDIFNFNNTLIKTINKNENGNYLISPYSIEVALNMLKEGSNSTTYNELNKILPSNKIADLNIKNRISVANAVFVKSMYQDNIKKDFISTVKNKYNSEILFDEFNSPDVINDWVKQKTFGMLDKVIDEVDPDFMLGLANALAIDVEWKYKFKCVNTIKSNFTVLDSTKEVEMMHNSYESNQKDVKYIKNDNEMAVILPYNSYNKEESETDTVDLQFIAVLPNNDVNKYIYDFNLEKYSSLMNGFKEIRPNEKLDVSLPRFKYDYSINNFNKYLINIGLRETFSENPNFSRIIDKNLKISSSVHKTHISLNEKGTKAAAVTYFSMANSSALDEKTIINIDFNKPFLYMIKDSKSDELLFFGVVKEPNEWKGSDCKIE